MHKAAMDDNTYIITYLRDKCGFDIKEVDFEGNTPLHYACFNLAEFAAIWLIGFGSDVNALNKNKDTPMHMLISSGKIKNTKTLRELIFQGADKNLMNAQD